jgi:hypothetical protein
VRHRADAIFSRSGNDHALYAIKTPTHRAPCALPHLSAGAMFFRIRLIELISKGMLTPPGQTKSSSRPFPCGSMPSAFFILSQRFDVRLPASRCTYVSCGYELQKGKKNKKNKTLVNAFYWGGSEDRSLGAP